MNKLFLINKQIFIYMRSLIILSFLIPMVLACQPKKEVKEEPISFQTFCNPIDISYRFCLDEPSRREAADPTIVWFKDRYYLFASKSGGYWHSTDLLGWTFIETNQIPTEEYAPTAVGINDTLYFLASSQEKSTIYKSGDPLSGKWSIAKEELEMPVWDPAFLLDDDQQLYLYWGCSNQNPLYGVMLDYKNDFSFSGEPVELKHPNPAEYGWEVPGDYNTLLHQAPWIEGAWVNKYKGKYYLQYSGPGTEYKSYSDGAYVSDNPLGPFTLQEHNPFAYKPEGFAAGAGHGSTFSDRYGNLWHIGTITISQKHMFERRLGLYPVFLDEQGTLYANTKYGDYPLILPGEKINSREEIFPEWMLLSYKKEVMVSSSIDSLPATSITDEEIRTYWAATSGSEGEFATVDLGEAMDVYALQVNFAEHATNLFGRVEGLKHRYIIEYSNDGNEWTMLADKSNNNTDNSHVYYQLPEKITGRYLKITNLEVPGGHFAISGFRVFGKGNGSVPETTTGLNATRDPENGRSVVLTWQQSGNADGYVISYGTEEDKLYQSYMVHDDTSLTINSLNANQDYYFTIESFNANGISKSDILIHLE